MKVFQIRSSIVLILSFSLIASGILVPNSSAQDVQIPDWIKNVAGWWASGVISENEFVTGIEYLINNNIILLDFVPCNDEIQSQYGDAKSVPDWIKNNANWWSENLIDDTDFINGLQYLIEYKIIKIDNKKILGKIPLEDVKFSSSWTIDKNFLVFVQSAFFEIYGKYGDCVMDGDNKVWRSSFVRIKPKQDGHVQRSCSLE